MTRFTWLGAAALTIALGAAMPAAAQTQEQQPAQAQQQRTFTDAQVSAFAAASVQIDPISREMANATPEQQAEAVTRIRAILAEHDLDGDTYNAIAAQARTDTALNARILAARESGAHGNEG